MLPLEGCGFHMTVMFRRDFFAPGARVHSALAAIVTDAMVGEIVGHISVIDVVKVLPADVVHGTVVVEIAASPLSPDEAEAGVAESIIDAAVETYVRAPISSMPNK
jgi:hypothetical protein